MTETAIQERPSTTTAKASAQTRSDAAQTSQRPRQEYSNPVLKQRISLRTQQAQRVVNRSLARVSYALFSLDVILRIIGEPKEVDEVEKMISDAIDAVSKELIATTQQIKAVMKSAAIEELAPYSNPMEVEVEITSPHVAKYVRLIVMLDELIAHIDTVWLQGELKSNQRANLNTNWQGRLVNLANRIISIERRARLAARAKGKGDEVDTAAPQMGSDAVEAEAQDETAAEMVDDTKQKNSQ